MSVDNPKRGSILEEFVREFPTVWKGLPNKGLFAGLFAIWVLLFQFVGNSTFGYVNTHSLLEWARWAYIRHPDDEHGLYIPLVVLVLFWLKRAEFAGVVAKPSFAAFAIILVALAMHTFGYVVQQTRISLAAFFFGLYGLIGLTWGTRVLVKSFFPMCLFAFAIPLGTLAETITFPLRLVATQITTLIASTVLGISVMQQGTQIFDPTGKFSYEVAAACGGLRSLTAILALCTIYGFLNFPSAWKRVVMIGAAFPLALAANVSRLLMIITVAEAFGQKQGEWVHDNGFFSMLPYVPAIVGILVLGYLLKEKSKQSPPPVVDAAQQPA